MNLQSKEWIPVSILNLCDYVYLNFRLLLLRRNTVSYLQLWLLSKFVLTSKASMQLPIALYSWRILADEEKYKKVWDTLAPLLQQQGFTFWAEHINENNQAIDSPPLPNNYSFVPANLSNPARMVMRFGVANGLFHAVRGEDKKDYIVRVITSGGEGHNQLCIIRRLSSTFPDNMFSNFHILPMVLEVQFRDITFGFFPKAQYDLDYLFKTRESTVEDAVHMILQALEVTVIFSPWRGLNTESHWSGHRLHSRQTDCPQGK